MTAATCACGAPVVFPKLGLCRPCYMRGWRAAHPAAALRTLNPSSVRRTPEPAVTPAPPGVAACACGAPVWIVRTGECKRCYHRRYGRERLSRIAEKVQRFNFDGYRFTTDANLEEARGSLFGVVLRCETCGDQLGPVNSAAAAAVDIADHLAQDHGVDLPHTACSVSGCRNVRLGKGVNFGGELCRFHRDERTRLDKRETKVRLLRERQAALEAQAQAARDSIAAEIARRASRRAER